MSYLGDFAEDAMLYFTWDTSDGDGASVTRATNGAIWVYKDDADGTEVQTGITDTEDFDTLTGIHMCKIDLNSAAFYATGADYHVILKAATIDGQTVNATLATFSIENRFMRGTDSAATASALTTHATALGVVDGNVDDILADTADLQGNQGAWATATGFATSDALTTHATALGVVDGNVDSILADTGTTGVKIATDALDAAALKADAVTEIRNAITGGAYALDTDGSGRVRVVAGTAAGELSFSSGVIAANVTQLGGGAQSLTDLKDFADAGYDPLTNKVQGVVLCDTTTNNSDMVGTNSAALASDLNVVDSNVSYILEDTGDLQANQGAWATAVGFSTHNAAAIWAVATRQLTGTQTFNLTGNITGNLIGDVTGNVDGNVGGTIGGLTAAALKDFFDTNSTTTYASAVSGSVVKEIADNASATISDGDKNDIADKVWDETMSDHLGGGSTGAKLNGATGAAGSGAVTFTYTMYEDDESTPLAGVDVWVCTDEAGSNVVAGTVVTDVSGEAIFYLDAATYYFFRQKPSWNFTNPDTEVVSE